MKTFGFPDGIALRAGWAALGWLLLCVSLSLLASPGEADSEGGLGGTGLRQDPDSEGGLGGTGILGVITGFGSLLVNGVHVDYDPEMVLGGPFADGRATAATLARGQVVEMLADPQPRTGRYRARAIHPRQAIAGPVTTFTPADQSLRVLGQRVQLSEATYLETGTTLHLGERVVVSGLWEGPRLHATHLARDSGTQDFLAGPVRTRLDRERLLVGDVPVRLVGGDAGATLAAGDEVWLVGHKRAGWMVARPVAFSSLVFSSRPTELILEGYPRRGIRGLRLYGQLLEGQAPEPGSPVVLRGRPETPGSLRVQALSPPAPPTPATRGQRWPGYREALPGPGADLSPAVPGLHRAPGVLRRAHGSSNRRASGRSRGRGRAGRAGGGRRGRR